MSNLTKWTADFTTPIVGSGLLSFAAQDFVLHVNVGRNDRRREGVDRHSTVLASISELGTLPGQPLDFPFIGSASMEIRNIAPRDDGIVDMWIHIEWFAPLNARISFVVVND